MGNTFLATTVSLYQSKKYSVFAVSVLVVDSRLKPVMMKQHKNPSILREISENKFIKMAFHDYCSVSDPDPDPDPHGSRR